MNEQEAYDTMFELLVADEFMEFRLPLDMGIGTKNDWIEHICKQESISKEDWNTIILTYLFMGYSSSMFIKEYRERKITKIPLNIKMAVKLCIEKEKWEAERKT